MQYYRDKNNEIHSFDDDVDKNVNKEKYDKYLRSEVENEGFVKLSGIDEAKEIIEASKTTEQRISEVRSRYDKEVQRVCAAHLLNDINSARNLSTLENSPLYEIAKRITNWELEQQAIFIALLSDAESDIISIDNSTFDDIFIQFKSV